MGLIQADEVRRKVKLSIKRPSTTTLMAIHCQEKTTKEVTGPYSYRIPGGSPPTREGSSHEASQSGRATQISDDAKENEPSSQEADHLV